MFLHRCYYAVKPLLPWRLRMALRRNAASGLRRRFAATWPIDPGSPRPPVGWPGWPHDRRFAFVITHDVEGPAGLAKCRALAELEMRLGFRSCFNFVPEGAYAAPKELRVWLLANGFEVGVHDLHHDGKLFTSRRGFSAKAARLSSRSDLSPCSCSLAASRCCAGVGAGRMRRIMWMVLTRAAGGRVSM